MINLITGVPGNGKSLFALKHVHDKAIKENRQVYYHNIPELDIPNLKLPWLYLEDAEKWYECPPNSIIIIDEAQNWFRPRSAAVKPPLHVSNLEVHRQKFSVDLFFITQDPMLVDGNLRKLTGKHYHLERFYGFAKSTVHEFEKCRDNVAKSTKNSIQTHFLFPKEVFGWYKSADVHTIKRRVPMRLIMMFILPVVLGYILWQGYNTISAIQTADEKKELKANDGLKTLDGIVQPIQPLKLDYVQAHTPVIPDFPHTAPIYEKVTEPVRAPYPAACVMSKSKGCQCYTEQGTALRVSLNVCNQIVHTGFYVDWELDQKKESVKQSDKRSALVDAASQHVGWQPVQINDVGVRASPS